MILYLSTLGAVSESELKVHKSLVLVKFFRGNIVPAPGVLPPTDSYFAKNVSFVACGAFVVPHAAQIHANAGTMVSIKVVNGGGT